MRYSKLLSTTSLAFRLVSLRMGTSAFALGASSSRRVSPAATAAAATTTTTLRNSSTSTGGNDRNDDDAKQCAGDAQTAIETTKKKKKKNPIDVFGIDHVVLLVDDLPGMSEWYQTVLGCRIAKVNEKFRMIHLDAGSSLIDLVDRAGPLGNDDDGGGGNGGRDDRMDHICLGLTDFDETAIRDHLAEHGVVITKDIGVRYGKGGNGESLYFRDPEGTTIEIKRSRLAPSL